MSEPKREGVTDILVLVGIGNKKKKKNDVSSPEMFVFIFCLPTTRYVHTRQVDQVYHPAVRCASHNIFDVGTLLLLASTLFVGMH